MKFILYSLIAALILPVQAEDNKVFKKSIEAAGDVVQVEIVEGDFDKSEHKIESGLGNEAWKVDGKHPLGSDGMIPRRELKSFTLTWGGKKIPVPKKLWADCFNLGLHFTEIPLGAEPGDIPQLRVTENGNYLILDFEGSDGAGFYQITWILAKSGQHARWIQ